MRSLNEIDRDIKDAREALSTVEGSTAEVYSRIVGYYRSVRNWNKGKREEYGERRLFDVEKQQPIAETETGQTLSIASVEREIKDDSSASGSRVLLFVRPACPNCPGAKTAAGNLGIPVDTVNADTEEGLAEAARHNVMSTPTAILISNDGHEIDRARDSSSIARFSRFMQERAAS
ncbi:hypothetical protein AGMMS50212_10560 [Spirochaetia bacterium]|nr:hypothetical protein AGMMS50212_10560 [Spirochaetia bacterium]